MGENLSLPVKNMNNEERQAQSPHCHLNLRGAQIESADIHTLEQKISELGGSFLFPFLPRQLPPTQEIKRSSCSPSYHSPYFRSSSSSESHDDEDRASKREGESVCASASWSSLLGSRSECNDGGPEGVAVWCGEGKEERGSDGYINCLFMSDLYNK